MSRAARDRCSIKIKLLVVMGSHVAYGDALAELRCASGMTEARAEAAGKAALAAVRVDDERDLDRDAAYGILQLATIGWTLVSTAHSNPQPGILVCEALRDIVARWSQTDDVRENALSPVVYEDRVPSAPISAMESLAVAVGGQHGISKQTIYVWPKRLGGLQSNDVRRLKQLEAEIARLKKLVAERDLEIEVISPMRLRELVGKSSRYNHWRDNVRGIYLN